MARRANISFSEDEDEGDFQSTSCRQRIKPGQNLNSPSPSPAVSFSSDKENRQSTSRTSRPANGKAKAMPLSRPSESRLLETSTPRAAKRRRLGERNGQNASQLAHEQELDNLAQKGHTKFYDPNQSMDERRAVRKGIRELAKELTGMVENSEPS